MKTLRSIIDLVLYGNIWIAMAALAMALQSQYIFVGEISWNPLNAFIFFSTLALYAAHRLIGRPKTVDFKDNQRFNTITNNRYFIGALMCVASIASAYYFWLLDYRLWLLFAPSIAMSLGYILPVSKGKRLRDFPFVKIFLIAVSWAWITGAMPFFYYQQANYPFLWTLLLERICFLLAITLPFDIRDLAFDNHHKVATIPSHYGVAFTRKISYLMLGLAALLVTYSYVLNTYTTAHLLGILASYLLTLPLLIYSTPSRPDYYYTGGIDGTMIFQFLILYFI